MKRLTFIFVALLALSVTAFAQAGKGKQMREQAKAQKADDAFGELKSALSLTAEQEPKVKSAVENRNKELKAIREEIKAKYPNKDERQKNRAQINEEFKDKRKVAHQNFRQEMNSILNAEQQKKWKEFKSKKKQANKAKREAMQKSKKALSEEELDDMDEDNSDED